jgi:hypothetical protein
MEKISEDEFLKKCLEFLDHFDIDYKGDYIELSDGGNSCIANPKSQFAELFGGYSINSIARYVAKKLNKKTKWI